jgi:hypothetical protein
MGRSAEFHGAAYGNFEPAAVDIDLSDKVTDHPFYSQDPSLHFHEPDLPQSKTCQSPGCGRQLHEHRAQYLPPTREAMEMMGIMADRARLERRQGKEKEARQDAENDELMKGPYGTGPHTMSGKGWTDTGPKNKTELKRHIIEDHDIDPDDLKYMPHLARSHSLWHQQGDDDDHIHAPALRRKAE